MKITYFTNNRRKSLLRFFYFVITYLKLFFFRKYYFDLYNFYKLLKYPGHLVVVECLDLGSKNIGLNYNFNNYNKSLNEIAVVNSGIENLQHCLIEKKNKRIKFLVAGTNLVITPKDHNSIIANSLIDIIITPSKWISDYYVSQEPKLKNRIHEWYSGINHNYWVNLKLKREFITFYIKENDGSINDTENYIKVASKYGYGIKTIKYNKYNNKEYRRILNKSKFLIYFSNHESQGLATAEAWSCNTPTLIWNKTFTFINGQKVKSSCCPYLSNECGKFFNNIDDFTKILDDEYDENNYNPRKWVLNNMTHEISVRKLVNLITDKIKN